MQESAQAYTHGMYVPGDNTDESHPRAGGNGRESRVQQNLVTLQTQVGIRIICFCHLRKRGLRVTLSCIQKTGT